MKVNVKANIDPQLIAKRVPQADHELAVMAQKDTEQFVPMANRLLRNGTQVVDGKIVYPGPQAHYLYVGKVRVDPKTGAAGFLTEDGWKSRYGVKKKITNKDLTLAHPGVDPKAQPYWFEFSKSLNLDKWLKKYKEALTHGQ